MMFFRPSSIYFAAAAALSSALASNLKFVQAVEASPLFHAAPRPRITTKHRPTRSRYKPHQGERECARRVRQMQKAAAHDH